jgi:hypothetical protein
VTSRWHGRRTPPRPELPATYHPTRRQCSRLIPCEPPSVDAKSPFAFSSSRTTSASRSSRLCSSRAAEASCRPNAADRATPSRRLRRCLHSVDAMPKWSPYHLHDCHTKLLSPPRAAHRRQPPPSRPVVTPTRTLSAYRASPTRRPVAVTTRPICRHRFPSARMRLHVDRPL